jgi:hypothetical protein
MAYCSNRETGDRGDDEDAEGEVDEEFANDASTRVNATTSSRTIDKGKGTLPRAASSPFAPMTSPTPRNKAPSALATTAASSAAPVVVGSTGPAARMTTGDTAYDRTIAAEASNAAATGNRAGIASKGKASADLRTVLAEGFASHQQLATERLQAVDLRVAERD